MMKFNLANCTGYEAPERTHILHGKSPLCGLRWAQRGTTLTGRTLCSQCTGTTARGKRCQNSTTFDYRYCHRCLRERFSLMVGATTIPGLRGWGLFAVDAARFKQLGMEPHTNRPARDPHKLLFSANRIIGGKRCYFEGEYITTAECARRYPGRVCGDYVIEEEGDALIDGQVARTVLQFSNDALCLSKGRRNRPGHICMPDWPVVQNADGILIGEHVYLVALCDICHGDEITWCYSGDQKDSGDDYWSATNHAVPTQ